jgi:hypothetical protein
MADEKNAYQKGTDEPWKDHVNDEEVKKPPPDVIEQENRKTQDK